MCIPIHLRLTCPTLYPCNRAKFCLKEQYLAVIIAQRTHLAINENDLRQCRGRPKYKICPAEKAVLNNEITTCSLSLYLQMDNLHTVCERRVYMTPPVPTLIWHGAAIIFHSPESRQAFFRCKRETKCETSTYSLKGSGLIEGATACHVSTAGSHLHPVL